MARIEFPEETRRRIEEIGPADLVAGIAGAVNQEDLRAKAVEALAGMGGKIIVAYPGAASGAGMTSETATNGETHFVTYPPEQHDPSVIPWVEMASAQRSILAMAASFEARACVVIHSDLAVLNGPSLNLLSGPVMEGKCDLVTPVYPEGKYDGLINKSLLAPLSRALYGRRVHSPLPLDFSASSRVFSRLVDASRGRGYAGPQLLWPANVVASENGQIGQAYLDVRHTTQTDGLDLTEVLGQLAGSLFQEAEGAAANWQRIRGSQATQQWGTPPASAGNGSAAQSPVDPRPLIESFVLGSRNLEEIWRLVLPPVTVLDLKRLTRLEPAQFRMPDELWARVVYDFALAYRLRNISRGHLLGALTPLYLGWVASYTQEVANASVEESEQRLEQLARAYEENKPYLLARWRWPDRINS
jgi:glucosylglycerate synthase